MTERYILVIDPSTGQFIAKDRDSAAPSGDMNLYLPRRLEVVHDSIAQMISEQEWTLPDVLMGDEPVNLVVGDRFEPMLMLEKMIAVLEGGSGQLSVGIPDITMGYWMADLQRTGMLGEGPYYETARMLMEEVIPAGMDHFGRPVKLVSGFEARIPITLSPVRDETSFRAGYEKIDLN